MLFRNMLLFFLLSSGTVMAQKQMINISGTPDNSPIDPSTFKHIEIKGKGHDGKEYIYSGVPLSDILQKSGVILADKARRDALGTYVVIRAKDNYRVIFSLSELDPLLATKTIILADSVDGKPLDGNDAPFQVIVPGEKLHARWIRQVTSIEVGRVK